MSWAFWLACGLSAFAGLVPLVLGGASSRTGGIVIPFALAAVFFAACALLHKQGKTVATLLYFLASLAIVYGILAMLTLPLRLAVVGTCPPAPAACAAGLEPAMTSGESTAFGLTIGLGVIAILTGFFALVTLYRLVAPTPQPTTPPTRRIAPVTARAPMQGAASETAPAPPPSSVDSQGGAVPETTLELTAPAEPLELAAAAEPLELPEVGTADPAEPPAAAPRHKPRRKRIPNPPESLAAPGAGESA